MAKTLENAQGEEKKEVASAVKETVTQSTAPVDPNYVTVSKEKLEGLLNRLERLEAAASKAGLSRYDSTHAEDRGRVINLKTVNGKVVVRWDEMPSNVVEKNERGVWVENQTIHLHYEDGTEEEMPYVFFARRYKKMPCDVISETKNKQPETVRLEGTETYKLKSPEGVEYNIGSNFVG